MCVQTNTCIADAFVLQTFDAFLLVYTLYNTLRVLELLIIELSVGGSEGHGNYSQPFYILIKRCWIHNQLNKIKYNIFKFKQYV